MKKLLLIVLVLSAAGFIIAQGHHGNFNGKRGNFRGSRYNEDRYEVHEQIYENFSDMIENNRDKIEKIILDKQKYRLEIRQEIRKDNPNWGKIENLMKKNHELGEKIWEIRKDQRLKILKSLTPKQREQLGHRGFFHYGRGFRGGKRGSRNGYEKKGYGHHTQQGCW